MELTRVPLQARLSPRNPHLIGLFDAQRAAFFMDLDPDPDPDAPPIRAIAASPDQLDLDSDDFASRG